MKNKNLLKGVDCNIHKCLINWDSESCDSSCEIENGYCIYEEMEFIRELKFDTHIEESYPGETMEEKYNHYYYDCFEREENLGSNYDFEDEFENDIYNYPDEFIEEYESNNEIPVILLDVLEENTPWEITEIFLELMLDVKRSDENYSKIFLIDFYNNGFYYSKEEDDLFWEEWIHWDGKSLDGGKSRTWYYYFINRRIMKKHEADLSVLNNVECAFQTEIDYKKEWRELSLNENFNQFKF